MVFAKNEDGGILPQLRRVQRNAAIAKGYAEANKNYQAYSDDLEVLKDLNKQLDNNGQAITDNEQRMAKANEVTKNASQRAKDYGKQIATNAKTLTDFKRENEVEKPDQQKQGKWSDGLKSMASAGLSMIGNAFISAGVGMLVQGAFSLLGKGIDAFVHKNENLIAKGQEAKESIQSQTKAYEDQKASLGELTSKYTELSKGVKISGNSIKNISLTDDEYKDFLDTSNQIAAAAPSLTRSWDSQGNAILNAGTNAEDLNTQVNDYLKLQRNLTYYDTKKNISDQYKGYETALGENKGKQDEYKNAYDAAKYKVDSVQKFSDMLKKHTKGEDTITYTLDQTASETGHSGNGYCRITVIECKNTALYARINNSIKKATAFYFKLNNNKMYGVGSANYNGSVMNFDYTGSVQTATLTPGAYKLECWGAQGGNSNQSNGTYGNGGKGGYSTGILNVSTNTTIYITVGGQGQNGILNTRTAGGFNGGGDGYGTNNSGVGGGGGGASDISLMSPVFSHSSYFINNIRDTNSLLSRIIVAGGGGSAGYDVRNNAANGGAGGGTTGQDGLSNRVYHGTGGKQTTFGTGGSSEEPNRYSVQAKFGCGASASNSTDVAPGGGGGWYGGGLHCDSAGGGSGYVYTSATASNYPSGCLLNSTYYLSNAQTIAGNKSFPSPTGSTETGHSGNGHVKITKLSDVIYLTQAKNDIMDFNYTGSVQSKTLKPGTYTLECWGGQGGTYSSYIGGYGGYSKGTITLAKTTTVYVSVGGAGSSSSTTAGFNGGGTGISSGRGGGGATDVRIGQNSLYSRVIVAGGGGGAGVTSANANPCGCGGGEYGGDGYYNDTTGSYTIGQNRCGGSASQTAGGKTWSTSTQATFGQGGNASGYSCGGGGGGWYGGGGAYDNDSDSDGRWGGGGSGYVYTSSTAKNYPKCLFIRPCYRCRWRWF